MTQEEIDKRFYEACALSNFKVISRSSNMAVIESERSISIITWPRNDKRNPHVELPSAVNGRAVLGSRRFDRIKDVDWKRLITPEEMREKWKSLEK